MGLELSSATTVELDNIVDVGDKSDPEVRSRVKRTARGAGCKGLGEVDVSFLTCFWVELELR